MITLPTIENGFSVILADPAWTFVTRSKKGKGKSPEQHYDCMTFDDIKAMPVGDIAAKDSVLLMWTTDPMLEKSFEVIKAWGFTFKTPGFVWAKTNAKSPGFFMGCGYYTRCLDPKHNVFVMHKITKEIEYVSLDGLESSYDQYKVWSPTGWKNITGYSKSWSERTIKVDTVARTLVASPNHVWPVKRTSTPRRKDDYKKRKRVPIIEDMRTDRIFTRQHNITSSAKSASTNLLFSRLAMESSHPLTHLHGLELTYDLGWLLGVFVAEGSYRKDNGLGWSLNSNELDISKKLEEIVNSLNLYSPRYTQRKMEINQFFHSDKCSQTVYVYHETLKNFVESFMTGRTTKTKRIRMSSMLKTSKEFRTGFVDGCLTGDGTKGKHGYKNWRSMVMCQFELLNDIRIIMESVGIAASLSDKVHVSKSKIAKDSECYHLRIVSHQYGDNQNIYLRNGLWKESSIGQELVDLTVEDSYFIVEGIVTHNSNPEYCLLATKGKPKRLSRGVPKLIVSPRREHSRKPDETYKRIEKLFAGPYCELFARTTRPGWVSWGNETRKFDGE